MVAMTQVQFRQRAIAVLEQDTNKTSRDLSSPQEKILLAAYGVYAREIGRKSDQLKDEISDLKVLNEQKETDLVREQARAVLISMWNKETAKQLGNFLVTPISEWGRSDVVRNTDPLLIENTVDDVSQTEISSDTKTEKPNLDAKASNIGKDNLSENINTLPWYIMVPTSFASRIFGGMTPLSFALLFITVLAGAIAYGTYARGVWKDQYDAEVAATGSLRKKISEKDSKISNLLDVQSENEQLEIELAKIQKLLDSEKGKAILVRDELESEKDKFATFRAETAEKHSAELQRFQANVNEGWAQREREQTTQISRLEAQITGLERDALIHQKRIDELQIEYSSASEGERALQRKLQGLYDEQSALNRKNIDLSGQLTDLQAINRVLAGIPLAVNKYFWHSEGLLEIRRVCFRLFYTGQMRLHLEKIDELSIPSDMTWARYDLQKDARRLTERCSDY